ncbi:tRNA (adenosine(37)-N6)-threonylcarbamoyltransferase complex dimerization subunit type 1 TsaB [Virgibacillus dakarensis]|uniref:tRNA (Adenosine(37)-N6)-threonylcarbamoyltransferase complex dimerization subunit type 1 TsaB n=1 Tax=Lentibacillus populi TaxID=1827502 RepID=A0A9W5X5B1_9BACI|nr:MULTISPECIES: tRNA (adenosine(37)-N6)-threonylcarbamoyltransferase complex dimerization subunit type 1 TsaB [Bacillaceae]MTW87147.1 tRNA (adenosine(37)-N6)-threonylcarbamoyltransferase complex dimerization subunit type 1 TsaB [Virgibacillus dakarensis]GGB41257.1 tRNA (adenosine(37)-N6)-threonylcarbamoyltransferase complex dimerization subunit type 1 TsaB [Lentibacillus populi]
MNLLAIDTSNQVLGVALLKEDLLIGEIVTNIKKNHSVRLMPAIDQLMRETNMRPEMLDKIVVAKGPGSFTGVRIGLATAKAFAWALQIPIVGVSSLEVLAYQGCFVSSYICPFFDARRANVYTGLYRWQGDQVSLVKKERNVAMADWLQQLAAEQQEVLFLSPDIALYKDSIVKTMGDRAVIPKGPYHLAKPSHLALAGLGKNNDNTHTLTPNYLRLAEAEAKWLETQKGKRANG